MFESSDTSPWKQASDSPSRQLLRELSQLRIDGQRLFNEQLNEACREQDAAHRKALAAAEAKREKVRELALAELQLQREIEHQNQLREAERIRQEAARRKLALERERTEAAKAAEAVERAVEEERRARDSAAEKARLEKEARDKEAARLAAEKTEAERKAAEAQRQAAEAQAKAKEEAEQAAKAKAQAAISSRPSTLAPAPAAQTLPPNVSAAAAPRPIPDGREAEHARYLEIHKNLKSLRASVIAEGKRNPALKKQIGEARREIRKRVGQLTLDNKMNTKPISEVRNTLLAALSTPSPPVPVTDYLFEPPSPTPANPNGPSVLLYLLNIFSKSLVQQFLNEASVSPQSADPVGIIGSTIFAQPELQWHGTPLIDILLAKFHIVCPILFGIYGPPTTQAGRKRLGWQKENGDYVTPQRHAERMTGLGAGYAALTLRTYRRSKLSNPLPDWHFWRALARILNTRPEEIEETHLVVLKAMVELNVKRILEYFAEGGKAALRVAVIEFPHRAREKVRESAAARAVMVLKDGWEREERFYL